MSQQYDSYLKAHRGNVKRAYEWIAANLPECTDAIITRNIDLHDASKDEVSEYNAYDNYFYGKKKTAGKPNIYMFALSFKDSFNTPFNSYSDRRRLRRLRYDKLRQNRRQL